MIAEVLVATISMQAGRQLDHEFKEKKNKFSFSSIDAYRREEYSVPRRDTQSESEYIRSINDIVI